MATASVMITDLEKTNAVEHIFYELQMLLDCRALFENALKELGKATTERDKAFWSASQNVFLEGFLLHFRNLKQFLNNQKFPTDLKAAHYAPGWTAARKLVDANEDIRVNKKLAHLTYERATSARGWNPEEMEKRICEVFQMFLAKIDVQYHPLFSSCRTKLSVYGY
jgi:hypothetical protein